MTHEVYLFIANKKMNEFMRCMDLKPEYKVFVEVHKASITTSTPLTEEYFNKIISDSLGMDQDWWIPAIKYMGNFYHKSWRRMKLKEKLARENCKDNLDVNQNCMLCFLAGFEKAREMAKENTFKHLTNKTIDWQRCGDLIWFDLMRLGEEEV